MNTFNVYTRFVEERHRIWERRQAGAARPWTEDPILLSRKYTNVFRVLDPGSQFVITDLDHEDPETTLMRVFLYRHTNLPSAWRAYRDLRGRYPEGRPQLGDVGEVWREHKVFSGAYIIRPYEKDTPKLDQIVRLTEKAFTEGLAERFLSARTQPERYDALHQIYSVGDFMSMQILTDWGYTRHCPHDREDEFIVAGPGAARGAKILRPDRSPRETIEHLADYWAEEGSVEVTLPNGAVRTPSLMDVQNTLCEFSKHWRHRQKSPHKRVVPYSPAHPGEQPAPVYPRSWFAS